MCGAVGRRVGNDFFNGPLAEMGAWEIKVGKGRKKKCEDLEGPEGVCCAA